MSSRWRQTTPQELAGWIAGLDVPWGIAGGWGLELWAGESWREHSDIEITCFRDDLPNVLPALARFEIAVARNKVLTPFRQGDALPDPPYSLWLRRHSETLWDFEIVAEARDNEEWAYRRAPAIRRPAETVFRKVQGLPIIAPEIQLLFKTKEPRPKDLEDLRVCIPRLDRAARHWLRAAVVAAHPEFLATFDSIARWGHRPPE